MQIGEVAETTGLSLRTIRHYDEAGLVAPSGRSPGGFRLYTRADVDRLLLIRRMKPLGFTLEQMRDLLDVADRLETPGLPEAERRALTGRLDAYATAADERITALRTQLAHAEDFAATLRDRLAPRVVPPPRS
ncbi:MerR family transcriptional regulator [Actinocorallia populi]|uniref:MerR family transcriptional regulator n=1 Tax=Actinocorallia populi TaxID=2079200 RepID=UPI000D08D0C8|nr:MerR family transcriptional regulator [Actinocorallia populi]